MKFKRLVALLLSIQLICAPTVFASSDYSLEKTLEFIASKELKGRLVGTEGNEKAMVYIKDRFEDIGLTPFDEDYYHETTQTIHLPEDAYEEMVVTYNDGTTKHYDYGKEFLFRFPLKKAEGSGEITFDTKDPDLKNKILVLPEGENIYQYSRSCKGILLESKSFRRSSHVYNNATPLAAITEDVYNELKSNDIKNLKLSCEYIGKEEKVNNVVGKIKGKDSSKAMVISAHFDHVGWADDIIFDGAVDNASGVVALLDLAHRVKTYADENVLPMDILFVGFNGEESFLTCSYDFVLDLEDRYDSFFDINIDTIGLIKGGSLSVSGDPVMNKELIKDLVEAFDETGVAVLDKYVGASDNINFNHRGYSGINIGNTDVFGQNGGASIHTPDDTIDAVDLEEIENVIEGVFHFITSSKGNTYKTFVKVREEKRDKALEEYSLENVMNYIACDEMFGRLLGTKENDLTREFIAKEFEMIGLEPYGEDYFQSVGTEDIIQPYSSKESLLVTFEDGTSYNGIIGQDFLTSSLEQGTELESEITFDVNDPALGDKILVLPNTDELYTYYRKAKGILFVRDYFKRMAGGRDSGRSVMQISPEFFTFLQSQNIDKVTMSNSFRLMPQEIKNVAGVLKGKDSSKAIVVSAHFDHVGNVNGELIFNGAVDNGSGVVSVIDLARKLKMQSEKELFETDIIFVGFNAEEYSMPNGGFMLGSKGFVTDLESKYDSFYNLNIDSIGHITKGNLSISTDVELGRELPDLMAKHLNESGLVTNEPSGNGSDEYSFNLAGYCGITIGEDFETKMKGKHGIHSTGDTPDVIQFEQIRLVIDAIYDFILKYDGTMFEAKEK